MVLYRREWEWVHSRLVKMKSPTIEFQTLASRTKRALETIQTDPFYLAITEGQTHWINSRCKLVTLHQRPEWKAKSR